MTNENLKKSPEQLTREVTDMREKLRVIRFGGAGSRSRNVKEAYNIRKDIARALTELRFKKLAEIASETKTA